MEDTGYRQELLNGVKTERVIFAVTPELKQAIAHMAEQDCVTMSAFISSLIADEAVRRAR